jgi:hypothetical protein
VADSSSASIGFHVQPAVLADAAQQLTARSADLRSVGYSVTETPPSTAFGQLPESALYANALARSVAATRDDLDDAIDQVANIGDGLATGAQDYADLDALTAQKLRDRPSLR